MRTETGTELAVRRDYAGYVSEWHRVDSAARWIKGDLLSELVTSYGDKTLARFATDVGENLNTLQALRAVAVAYPEKSRRLDIRWSVHQALASQPDRAKLIASWSGTVKEARKLVSQRARDLKGRVAAVIIDAITESGVTTRQVLSALQDAGIDPWGSMRLVTDVTSELQTYGAIHARDDLWFPGPKPAAPRVDHAAGLQDATGLHLLDPDRDQDQDARAPEEASQDAGNPHRDTRRQRVLMTVVVLQQLDKHEQDPHWSPEDIKEVAEALKALMPARAVKQLAEQLD